MSSETNVMTDSQKNIEKVVASIKWMLPLLLIISAGMYVAKLIVFFFVSDVMDKAFLDYPIQTIGFPIAGLSSLALVLALEQRAEKVKFKAIGIELEGLAGQVILWLICFATIVLLLGNSAT
ncbi:hypothetical protein [Microbulbifer sp. MCCC 1A16149]|uniref:hypothetical protein n=1 Tax=Microbulbifer sp. MCCC 1A16149 TaxID=3411322 RepID=UPI003D14B67C